MLILFDQGTPRGIASSLAGHTVRKARTQGWDTLANGELLEAAETAGFELLLTTDKNLRYQQNLTHRKIAIVVLGKARWNDKTSASQHRDGSECRQARQF
jgi:hypothetical protein